MKYLYLLFLVLLSVTCHAQKSTSFLGAPVSAIETRLNQHLNNWFPHTVDTINGGYYTNFEYDWSLSKDQQSMVVTQARNLWTASKAAQLYPDNSIYRKAADHGFKHITRQLWDQKQGGFYLHFDSNSGKPLDAYKLIYGNSFVLYALAEYARMNPSEEAIYWVKKTFNWIEEVAHDQQYGGYFNIIPDKQLKSNSRKFEKITSKIGWGKSLWKGQNTSIHVLEALTATYKVVPQPQVKERLEEMLHLVRDTMVQESGTLKLYFTTNWQPIDHSDSTRNYILENIYTDHVSFGHNIETAYLLIDAAKTLYGELDEKTISVAKRLTDHTLQFGFDANFYGVFDKGYCFDNKMEIVASQKNWWSQVEALHTLALMHSYFPEESSYTEAFSSMWKYIENELWDHSYGGFYNNGLDTSPNEKTRRKGHQWKGPYHDGRALMQLWLYTR